MMRRRRPLMTVAQLKKSMDRRFRSVDRRIRSLKSEVHRLRAAIARSDDRNRRQFEETRRHFDVVAESLLDDLRIFADAIVRHSERLDQHDAQLTRLERRAQ
jgi:hypothetical protein